MNFENHLRANEIVVLVSKILETFLQLRIKKRKGGKDVFEFLRIDINILKETSNYSVQVSNCGTWKKDHYERILDIAHQFCDKLILKTKNHLLREEAICSENKVSIKTCNEDQDTIEFPHLKEYLSVKLKPKINSSNLRDFEEQVLQKISLLKDLYSNVKFTCFRDREILYNNLVELDKDYKSCCLLSSAMSNIVKQSQREEFRKQAFELFEVQNCEYLEFAIKSILLPKIYNNYDSMTIQNLRDLQGSEKYF